MNNNKYKQMKKAITWSPRLAKAGEQDMVMVERILSDELMEEWEIDRSQASQ